MKKVFVVLFSILALSALMLNTGCAPEENPSSPGAVPTVYVVPAGSSFSIDDFEDCNSTGEFGVLSYTTDESQGGNSDVLSFGAVSGGYNSSSCAIGLTVSAQPNLDYDSDGYMTQIQICTYKYGYVNVNIPFLSGGVDISNYECGLMLQMKGNDSGVRYRFFVHGKNGKVATTNATYVPTSWNMAYLYDGNLSVPAGAEYTVADVLGEITKIEVNFIFRECDPASQSTFEVFIDEIALYDIC